MVARILPATFNFVQNVHMRNTKWHLQTALISIALLLIACGPAAPTLAGRQAAGDRARYCAGCRNRVRARAGAAFRRASAYRRRADSQPCGRNRPGAAQTQGAFSRRHAAQQRESCRAALRAELPICARANHLQPRWVLPQNACRSGGEKAGGGSRFGAGNSVARSAG